MKIAFNGLSLIQTRYSGIHRNTIEILKELDKLCNPGEIEIIIPADSDIKWDFQNIDINKAGRNPYITKNKILSKMEMTLWRNYYFRAATKNKLRVDSLLLHPHCGCDVVFVYDCIPEKFPEMYRSNLKLWKNRYDTLRRQRKALTKCKVVITDSESAKKDLLHFYNLKKEDIYVVPCAWQHFITIQADSAIIDKLKLHNKQYYFTLGSQFEHKNIKWIIAAARQNPNYTFVVTGQRIMNYGSNELDNLLFTGYLSDGEIKSLMEHAKAFIQPSLYEGFGIPPMEAMSVGTDCIVSKCSSLPEVYNHSVWYIDPYDIDNIDMDLIESEPKEPNKIVLDKYSWARSAAILLDVLRGLQRSCDPS